MIEIALLSSYCEVGFTTRTLGGMFFPIRQPDNRTLIAPPQPTLSRLSVKGLRNTGAMSRHRDRWQHVNGHKGVGRLFVYINLGLHSS